MSSRSAELFLEAQKYLPGGVSRNTLLRKPHPFYNHHATGCRTVDVDGVDRIDFANNMASLIHGHAHPAIVAAVTEQLAKGTAFTMATEIEIDFARHLVGRSPSFDKVRFVNSGTEAVMAAIKAARAHTGRPKIAKVEGTYHGAYDFAEVSQEPAPHSWGERNHPNAVPLAMGTPQGILHDVVIIPFNDPDAACAILDEHRGELACVLIDPMPHRAGLIPADENFIRALWKWTRDDGALLVFDEVITFRTEVGGMQTRYKVRPDFTTMGKIIGGGFPVGAIAGRDETMAVFIPGPYGPRLPHSGTFSANPITMTAGLTAMELFDAAAVARLNALGELTRARLREAISASGAPASVTGTGSMFKLHFKAEAPRDYRSAFPTTEERHAHRAFIDALNDDGILTIYSAAGALSTPMTEVEINRLAAAVEAALRKAKEELVVR
ncbi:MAG: aspartate aminotransferase family protein [Myxococcales bacterium]|nr:aspartate aminotransferase family protein [Myxococcales bacterium]